MSLAIERFPANHKIRFAFARLLDLVMPAAAVTFVTTLRSSYNETTRTTGPILLHQPAYIDASPFCCGNRVIWRPHAVLSRPCHSLSKRMATARSPTLLRRRTPTRTL